MTPMMQQFRAAKNAHPGMLVLFQNGEFYELFDEDAELGHKVLGLTLTRREEHPMAGFPLAKLEHYLRLLLSAGHRVAVAEQMEPPNEGKKIIRREVTRVVTMGTVTEDELLDPKRPNHLTAIARGPGDIYGIAWADLTAGSFIAMDVPRMRLADELGRLSTAECLLAEQDIELISPVLGANGAKTVSSRPGWTFDHKTALEVLCKQFQVQTLTGLGFDDRQPCIAAAGAMLIYLQETLKSGLGHLRRLTPYQPDSHLILDEVTRRSLELTRTLRDNQRDGSVLSAIDRTVTSMGARFLHDALLTPLCHHGQIVARQDAVSEFVTNHSLREELRELLDATADVYRLTTRVATARATPRDLGAMCRTLKLLPKLKAKLTGRKSTRLQQLEVNLELCPDIRDKLESALTEELPIAVKEGGIIREGYSPELDELRKLSREGKDWIAKFQAAEITRSGITSLKVGFTEVMGYYIEITNANENRVPSDYLHERTLKNAKRYTTPQLKEYEEKVLSAQDKGFALEFELFTMLRDSVAAQTERLMQTADVISEADFLAGLAELAATRNYVKPMLTTEAELNIVGGRHPVLDQILPAGTFVPNDTRLSLDDGLFWLITGPNMAGKSTFIRQTALLVILTHIGSFIPADSATIGLTDRVFTRVGASDELNRGQSTFMVEMTEAANILNNATPRSVVILDEIGRGTSTYDGVSLAWAITEYLHDVVSCRTLFATHYHELAQLAASLPRLRNYNVLIHEAQGEIFFLHKIASGNADKSYGVHVARLAGVPEPVLTRAEQVLATLENRHQLPTPTKPKMERKKEKAQPQSITVEPPEKPRKPKPSSPNLFGE